MNMLQISVTGGVLILAAVLFRAAGRKRLPMRTFTVLWHIALLRLLLPVALPASFSAASVWQRLIRSLTGTFSRADGADIADVSASPAFSDVPGGTFFYESAYTDYPVSDALSAPNAAEEIVSSARFVPDWRIVVWIAGAVLCLSVFAALYVRALRRFRQSLPLESDFARDWLATHAPRRKIEVRRSDRIDSPLTYGVLCPVILLPSDTDLSDTKRLEFILAHELTHIRHFDSLTKILLALAVSLHWFNPAVWALYCFFNRDMELACDEAVVRMFGEDTRRDYALMLLELVEKKNLLPLPSGANGFGQVAIRERIGAIMKVRRITWAASLAAVIAVCGITAVFATTAAQEKPEEPEQTEQADTFAAGQEEQERLLEAATEAEQAEKLRIEAEQYARHEAERALAEVLEAREAQQLAEEQAQLQAELAEQLRREAEQYAREAMERALEAERQGQEIPEESELSEQTDALAAEQEEQARLLEAQLQAQLQAELAEQLRREAEQYAREAVERALEAERQGQEEVQADIPLWEKYNMTEEEYMSEKNLRFREKLEEKEARRLAEEAARQLAEEQQAREEQVSEPDIPAWVKLGISEDEYLHGEKYQKIREKLEEKEARRRAEAAGEGGTEYPTLP